MHLRFTTGAFVRFAFLFIFVLLSAFVMWHMRLGGLYVRLPNQLCVSGNFWKNSTLDHKSKIPVPML